MQESKRDEDFSQGEGVENFQLTDGSEIEVHSEYVQNKFSKIFSLIQASYDMHCILCGIFDLCSLLIESFLVPFKNVLSTVLNTLQTSACLVTGEVNFTIFNQFVRSDFQFS